MWHNKLRALITNSSYHDGQTKFIPVSWIQYSNEKIQVQIPREREREREKREREREVTTLHLHVLSLSFYILMNRLHTRVFLTTYLFQYLKKNSPKQLDTSARLRSVISTLSFLLNCHLSSVTAYSSLSHCMCHLRERLIITDILKTR